jgi:hypothetical protein
MDFVQSCQEREGSGSIWIDDIELSIIGSVWFSLVFWHFHWVSSTILFLIIANILLSQAQGVTVGKAQRKPLKQGKQVSR